jgi:hypothetical protein
MIPLNRVQALVFIIKVRSSYSKKAMIIISTRFVFEILGRNDTQEYILSKKFAM